MEEMLFVCVCDDLNIIEDCETFFPVLLVEYLYFT